ncbi:restriction endonuclease subunit S, partial [Candidatus Margulisiibacteriota bacterium]
MNEHRPGYKKTKLGWIPEDWDINTLEKSGIFHKGAGISKSDITREGIPCILYGHIYTLHNFYIKQFFSFINKATSQKSKLIKKGDVLFAGSGETIEEIGKCVAYLNDIEAYAGGDIIIFRPN